MYIYEIDKMNDEQLRMNINDLVLVKDLGLVENFKEWEQQYNELKEELNLRGKVAA